MRSVPALSGISAFVLIMSGAILAMPCAAGEAAGESLHAPSAPRAVVELFTSQGCSSCVAADKYLSDLAGRDDVVALSLHVDYWDYLGWRDTLGDAHNTDRQQAYAAVHGSRRVYTPQAIVNGGQDFIGSNRSAIDAAIAGSSLPVPVSMGHGDGTIEIKVGALPNPEQATATIRLAVITSEVAVPIARGENAGATVEYYNVVRSMRPIGMWNGHEVKITLPVRDTMPPGTDGCAIIVQEDRSGGPGPIIGAALLGGW
jgi:hypothetical protein